MSWDTIFLLVNYWAFASWIALAFLPRGPKILAVILYAGVFLLCLAYTVMIGGFLSGVPSIPAVPAAAISRRWRGS